MALHSSTYLETSAHLYPERGNLDTLPLERLFMDVTWLRVPCGTQEAITAADLAAALERTGQPLHPGDALGCRDRLVPPMGTPRAIHSIRHSSGRTPSNGSSSAAWGC